MLRRLWQQRKTTIVDHLSLHGCSTLRHVILVLFLARASAHNSMKRRVSSDQRPATSLRPEHHLNQPHLARESSLHNEWETPEWCQTALSQTGGSHQRSPADDHHRIKCCNVQVTHHDFPEQVSFFPLDNTEHPAMKIVRQNRLSHTTSWTMAGLSHAAKTSTPSKKEAAKPRAAAHERIDACLQHIWDVVSVGNCKCPSDVWNREIIVHQLP